MLAEIAPFLHFPAMADRMADRARLAWRLKALHNQLHKQEPC